MLKFDPINKVKDEKGNELNCMSASRIDGTVLPVRVCIDHHAGDYLLDAIGPSGTSRIGRIRIIEEMSRFKLEAQILDYVDAQAGDAAMAAVSAISTETERVF